MKNLTTSIVFSLLCLVTYGQTKGQGGIPFEFSKEKSEYYSKQYIVDEILKVPVGQPTDVYIDGLTAAKSGEFAVVGYECNQLHKKGIVFAFWNKFNNGIIPYQGYSFYNLDLEQAKELLNYLESLMEKENKILTFTEGNLIYKTADLTFLFYPRFNCTGDCPDIRVWWGAFDSDWTRVNLKNTIKAFRKFFNLTK